MDKTGNESRMDERGTERESVSVMLKRILCDCRCIEVPRCLFGLFSAHVCYQCLSSQLI